MLCHGRFLFMGHAAQTAGPKEGRDGARPSRLIYVERHGPWWPQGWVGATTGQRVRDWAGDFAAW